MQKSRRANRTLLLVGEGDSDAAFLKYLRTIYLTRGCGITAKISNAHGKGPDHIIDYSIRQDQNAAYDQVIILMDSDLKASSEMTKKAKSRKFKIILTKPCLEGLFLKILGRYVPDNSKECKVRISTVSQSSLTIPDNYAEFFPKNYLDGRRQKVAELNELLNCLTSRK